MKKWSVSFKDKSKRLSILHLKEGTGTATGKTLQSALSAVWGELVKHYKDETVTPIYFVSTDDIAEYLGSK